MRKILVSLLALITLTAFAEELNREITEGKVSYYGNKFQNRKTASGERFDKNKLTAASNIYPLGTFLKVSRIKNGDTLSVNVKVNDRMSIKYGDNRALDLSEAAMKTLQGRKEGVIKVTIQPISYANG